MVQRIFLCHNHSVAVVIGGGVVVVVIIVVALSMCNDAADSLAVFVDLAVSWLAVHYHQSQGRTA